MKNIKAFLKSAGLTAVVFLLITVGMYGMLKVDNAAGYASSQTDEIVGKGSLYTFSIFGKKLTFNLEELEKNSITTVELFLLTL